MEKLIGWAMWHPVIGFDYFAEEGPLVYAGLHEDLVREVKIRNQDEGTSNLNGWRVVKVEVRKVM